jgi:hypothetical protein
MKIISLSIVDYRKIRCVEITPKGNVVQITGKNSQGKSCILQAAVTALGGGAVEPEVPIRRGQTCAMIALQTDEFKLEWRKTQTKTYLQITLPDGTPVKNPLSWLKERIGAVDFDPQGWLTLKPKDQRQALLELVPDADFSKFDGEIQRLAEKRKEVMAEKRRGDANLEQLPVHGPDVPDKEVSAADLAKKLMDSQKVNAERAEAVEAMDQHTKDLDDCQQEMIELEEKATKLAAQLEATKKRLETTTIIDLAPIQKQLAEVDGINAKVRQKQQRQAIEAGVATLAEQITDLHHKIQDVESSKAKAMTEIKWPVDKLSVDETGVLYQGLPIAETNTAKRDEIALALWMARNPWMKDVFIDANSLDTESFQRFAALADTKDIRVWMEKATDGEALSNAIVIEDGSIKGDGNATD